MDTTFDMPPVSVDAPEDTTEARRRKLAFMPPVSPDRAGNVSGAPSPQPAIPMPPAAATQPSIRPQAFATPLEGRDRDLSISATNQPAMPPVKAMPQPAAPDMGNAMPPVAGLNVNAGQPAKPATLGGQEEIPTPKEGMPPVQVGPAQKRLEELNEKGPPQPKWWQRALEIAGSIHPLGRLIESQIPATPLGYNTQLNQAAIRAAKEQSGQAAQTAQGREAAGEARAAEAAPIKNRLETAQAREAEARADQMEEGKKDASDKKIDEYVNDEGKRVLTFQGADGKPYDVVGGKTFQKEPPENAKDKDISDYLEAHKLPDTAANREQARGAIAQRSKPEVNANDAKDIAAAIMRGDQPPTTTGLYRNAAAVRAELGRQGFNLAQAESDWHATQKHIATLNGAQQERLRQAVSFTNDSLGIIDDLYNQWQKVGKTSGWKSFNKASLATAKQLPGEAGNIAHRLEAQINDLTSELGTVYKGGNSSTDESLKLAAGNLAADWNEKTFKDAISQIRKNLEIRTNSIKHSQPAGVSGNSPYTPEGETEGTSAFDKWKKSQKP